MNQMFLAEFDANISITEVEIKENVEYPKEMGILFPFKNTQ